MTTHETESTLTGGAVPPAVEAARDRLTATQAAVAARLADWEASLLDEPQAAQDAAEASYRAAQGDEERARLALAAAERRHAAELLAVEAAERAQRWAATRRLLDQRRALAAEVEAAVASVKDAAGRWQRLDDELRCTHPALALDTSSVVGARRVEDLVRLTVNKAQLPGCDLSPSIAAGLPTLAETVARDERTLLHGAPASADERKAPPTPQAPRPTAREGQLPRSKRHRATLST